MRYYFYLILLICCFAIKVHGQIITTIAGNGSAGYNGDGGPALAAEFKDPASITIDTFGNIYIDDWANARIRKLSTNGIITTVAGNGTVGYSGDGGPATAAQISAAYITISDAAGNLYIGDRFNNCVRKVNTLGIITTIAGTGTAGFSGDGGQATNAELNGPYGVALDAIGNFYISESTNNRIRKVNTSGIITTIAGNGTQGYSGDGGQATNAEFNNASCMAFDANNNLYIADENNNCIRMINNLGIINTIAGNGTATYSGDGGQATAAALYMPIGITIDAAGNIYIADTHNYRIRKVNTAGIISTIAGNGTLGFSGDGGQAIAAELSGAWGLVFDNANNLLFSDQGNQRIRKISNVGQADIEEFTNGYEQTNIYPNPSNGSFSITSNHIIDDIKIANILGQTVYEAKPNYENTILKIDNSGIYFISITSGKETITKKVIVDK